MKVRLTATVRKRLRQIRAYYSEKENPSKGRSITLLILSESKKLENYPHLGQEEQQLKELEQGHRYLLLEKHYKVIYRIVEPFIYVTDIFDTRQDPGNMKH